MKVLIIEDEGLAAKRLQKLIMDIDPQIQVVEFLESVRSSAHWINSNQKPDLIFMDIQLSDGLSFEIFQQTHIESPVIFTTAYDEYALQAFKVNSIDYLLKPIDTDELRRSLDKFKSMKSPLAISGMDIELLLKNVSQQQKTFRSRFLVTFRDEFIMIPTAQIAYFYSEHKLTNLVRADGKKFIIEQTLEEISNELNPTEFFRANRQIILSANSIANIHKYFNGKLKLDLNPPIHLDLIVSRETAPEFKAWLDR